MKNVLLITNIPAPYRENVYEIIAGNQNFSFSVIYCAGIEPNRKWKFQLGHYRKLFLESRQVDFLGRSIYLGSDVWRVLSDNKPDIIIVCGFSMPMLMSYLWAISHGTKLISFTDGTIDSENNLTFVHKIIRFVFFRISRSCIGASEKSMFMISSYTKQSDNVFQSKLSIDIANYVQEKKKSKDREFDIVLCGQMTSVKMFDFSLSVIQKCQIVNPDIVVKVKIIGDGPDRELILEHANSLQLDFTYAGFLQQHELFEHYSNAKLFLFPSAREAWGIVANEACASGTPVITTPNTGCSGELIIDGFNGYVLEPDIDLWAKKILFLLSNVEVLQQYSDNCIIQSDIFTQQQSADGIIKAVEYALMAAK